MSWQEPHEAQQRGVPSPASEEEKPHAPVYAGGCPAEKQLGRKDSGCPGGHQVHRELVIQACGKEVQQYSGLH